MSRNLDAAAQARTRTYAVPPDAPASDKQLPTARPIKMVGKIARNAMPPLVLDWRTRSKQHLNVLARNRTKSERPIHPHSYKARRNSLWMILFPSSASTLYTLGSN